MGFYGDELDFTSFFGFVRFFGDESDFTRISMGLVWD
jgi:hypothetical protein